MLKTRQEIEKWLDSMGINSYSIQADLTVNVEGTVNLYGQQLDEIPVQFGKTGHFSVAKNKLISLRGSPHTVNGIFNCSKNLLTSLENGPKVVLCDYYSHENRLISLLGCPVQLNSAFCCSSNNITSLEHLPSEIKGNLYLRNNQLTSFEHLPSKIGGFLKVEYNPIISIEHLHGNIGNIMSHSIMASDQMIPLLESFYTFYEDLNIYHLNMSGKQIKEVLLYRDLQHSISNKNVTIQKMKI